MRREETDPDVRETPKRTFRVMWSLRGRATVEAQDELAARLEFYHLVEKGLLSPEDGDCDGYQVDDVELVE